MQTKTSRRLRVFGDAVCVALAMLVCALTNPAAAQDRPNVLVIISDDAGWADFGFQGSNKVPTPNLDALATRGVIFPNAYAGSVCSPSRAMLTTGMYTGRIGYNNNIGSEGYNNRPITDVPIVQGLPLSAVTIWERMQSVGYSTACIGKWHLGGHVNGVRDGRPVLGNRPQNQGIEHFAGLISGSRSYWIGEAQGTQQLQLTVSDGRGNVASDDIIESRFPQRAYVTDVLGTLTVDYIREHHDADRPFFLYSSFTAPHTPMQATEEDLAAAGALGHDFPVNRRRQVAMQIALDRNVGRIMDALDDPNGDGDTADSIRDNTLVIFVNDNGGDSSDSSPNYSSNWPLRDGKGSQWDGGIRVPMIVAGAGVDPAYLDDDIDVFEHPVHVIDILPTAFAVGGGSFTDDDVIDGVDLLPYINATAEGPPHETLYLRRYSGGKHAVRMGDYKLMYSPTLGHVLFNLAEDPGERNNIADQHPDIVAHLQRVMTDYDVQMDRPRYDNLAMRTNQFNDLRYREGAAVQGVWSAENMWVDADRPVQASMTMFDACPNTVLIFRNRNNDYTATNDLTRAGGLDFIANSIRFVDRNEALPSDGSATIDGLPVLLCNSLAGASPSIALNAHLAGPHVYTYDLALDVNLYDDLMVTGNGNQRFVISGDLREYREGLSLTKTGSSTLTLTGSNNLTGTVRVESGRLVSGNGEALGHADLRVGPGALLTCEHALELAPGRTLTLAVGGEEDAPGVVADSATLAGRLVLDFSSARPEAGQRVAVIRAGSVHQTFDAVEAIGLTAGLVPVVHYTDQNVWVELRPASGEPNEALASAGDVDLP